MTETKQQRFARQVGRLKTELEQYRGRRMAVPEGASATMAVEIYRRNGDDDGQALHYLIGGLFGLINRGTFTMSDADGVADAISAALEYARPKNGVRPS
jgi:hypothetical protein